MLSCTSVEWVCQTFERATGIVRNLDHRPGEMPQKALSEVSRQMWPARAISRFGGSKQTLLPPDPVRDVCAMEESERPTEFLEEQIHHHALHSERRPDSLGRRDRGHPRHFCCRGLPTQQQPFKRSHDAPDPIERSVVLLSGKRPQGDSPGFENRAARCSE